MSPKKRSISNADSIDPSTKPAPAKRQRVSLACDACRAAREKCDGGKPNCGACASQSRPCSYTPTSKKRGVQTGYLRSIELSLSWLFDQVPENERALYRLLTGDGAGLLGKSKTGNRLHRRWCKSRVHKEIGRLLSENPTPRTDGSAEDSDTDEAVSADADNSPHIAPDFDSPGLTSRETNYRDESRERSRIGRRPRPTRLPPNWKRLLDVHSAYTHCWLPISDRRQLAETAASYPHGGLDLTSAADVDTQGAHAELWAAMAVAAFQDSQNTTASYSPHVDDPGGILAISRSLVPRDFETATLSHLRASLFHAVVLAGRGNDLAAWLLVGNVTRLSLHKRSKTSYERGHDLQEQAAGAGSVEQVVTACSFLDSVLCLNIGQTPQSPVIDLSNSADPDSMYPEETWRPLAGLGPEDRQSEHQPSAISQPFSTLAQLSRFSHVLNLSRSRQGPGPRISPDDLVKTLQPQFGFCNSLVFGGSTPSIPSAYLVQATFLTVTMALLPGQRTSLLSNFMEVVESCASTFGARGTPPIFATLLGVIRQRGQLDQMHDSERRRWTTLLDSLQNVWQKPPTAVELQRESHHEPLAGVNGLQQTPDTLSFAPSLLTPTYQDGHDLHPAGPTASGYSLPEVEQQAAQTRFSKANVAPRGMMHTGNMGFQSPALGTGHLTPVGYQNPGMQPGQTIDYDAILEELGSIDCNDSIDVDPQFMTNLGFAPGCDLGDMFQGDLGI